MNHKHRLMQKELKEGICQICGDYFISLHIHHIDGNHLNNKKDNLLCCCGTCHNKIEKGLTSRCRTYSENRMNKILHYRAILLKKKFKKNRQETQDILNYEIFKTKGSFKFYPKDKCYICDKKRNLIFIVPKFINIFKLDAKKYSLPLCRNCYKEIKTG